MRFLMTALILVCSVVAACESCPYTAGHFQEDWNEGYRCRTIRSYSDVVLCVGDQVDGLKSWRVDGRTLILVAGDPGTDGFYANDLKKTWKRTRNCPFEFRVVIERDGQTYAARKAYGRDCQLVVEAG